MKFPRIETVLVFKNGNCVIRKVIELPKESNKVRTEMPASCVHGTCWITSNAKILSLKSVMSDRVHEETSKASNIRELLLGNIGNAVSLVFERCEVNGRLLGVEGTMVILENEGEESKGENFYTINDIRSVGGDRLNRVFKREQKIREIEVEYETEKDDVGVLYSILKKCSWAPSYLLTLNTETRTANLKMQAVIVNDSQNFFAKEFICAAGSPKFMYQNVQDPFVTEGLTHESFLSQLGTSAITRRSPSRYPMYPFYQQMPQAYSSTNVLQQQPMQQMQQMQPQQSLSLPRPSIRSSEEEEEEEEGKAPGSATDYYYYKFEDISIMKGQRVLLPVFSQDMKYTELYKCKLVYQRPGTSKIDPLKVTHIVKIKNNTKKDMIWTTGPVCIRSEKQLFAGQSTIYFTTPGIDGLVDIADALSIRVKYDESMKVNPRVKRNFGYDRTEYVQGIQKCVVNVSNFQDKDIIILLETDFIGVYDEKTSSEKASKNVTRLNSSFQSDVNTHVEFEVLVKKGERKEINFQYFKWIHNRNVGHHQYVQY